MRPRRPLAAGGIPCRPAGRWSPRRAELRHQARPAQVPARVMPL